MIELLREMGQTRRNKELAIRFIEYHRDAFRKARYDQLEADRHKREYAFWLHQLTLHNKILHQLHDRLQGIINKAV